MATIKGFFDDSGSPNYRDHSYFSIGGYLAPVEIWDGFEAAWLDVLKKFDVPHFHMTDVNNRAGPYKKWKKGNPSDDAIVTELLQSLTEVIGRYRLKGFGSVVAIDDLARFNRDRHRSLEIKALTIYTALLRVRQAYTNLDVEILVDRMDGAHGAIALAEQYGKTDKVYPQMRNFPTMIPLPKNGERGAENIPALQAADFLAWEIRKGFELKKGWFRDYAPDASDPTVGQSLFKWYIDDRIEHMKRHNLQSIELTSPGGGRRSLIALADAADADGALWDYRSLCGADDARGGVWGHSSEAQSS